MIYFSCWSFFLNRVLKVEVSKLLLILFIFIFLDKIILTMRLTTLIIIFFFNYHRKNYIYFDFSFSLIPHKNIFLLIFSPLTYPAYFFYFHFFLKRIINSFGFTCVSFHSLRILKPSVKSWQDLHKLKILNFICHVKIIIL